jgi:formyl-CoA transferase
VRVSGWGQDGPYRDKPGFGSLVEGMSGFASKNGFADRPPVLPPLALADMIAGLYGSNAVLIALREIEQRGGNGQVIDLPLLDPIFSILGPEAALYKLTHKIEPRVGSRSNNTSPRNVYETKDGRFISISASIQNMAERLFRAIGRADMIDDPRFRTNSDRVKNIDECDRPVAEFIKARTLAEGLAIFEAAEVTAAPVYDIDQFIADPHVRAREIVTELPDAEMGSVPMHAIVPRLSGTPGDIRTPAPALGEHNNEILSDLGLSGAAIDDLRSRKVI